jgi:hypothetical protein
MKQLLQFINKIIKDKLNNLSDNLSDILEIIYHNIETYKYIILYLFPEEIYEILKYICFILIIINIILIKYFTTKYNMFESIYSLLNYIIYNNILFYIIIFIIIICLNQIIIKYKNIIDWFIYILKLILHFIKTILILILLLFICIKFSLYTNNFSIEDLNIFLSVNWVAIYNFKVKNYNNSRNINNEDINNEAYNKTFNKEDNVWTWDIWKDNFNLGENPIDFAKNLYYISDNLTDLEILDTLFEIFQGNEEYILEYYYYYLYNLIKSSSKVSEWDIAF